ncbi:MAG: capsule assembly Wzi family protein [Bacteroidota bacterium]|nr:capsule assembly Wzi family protein [Bacteroidota bacterium]
MKQPLMSFLGLAYMVRLFLFISLGTLLPGFILLGQTDSSKNVTQTLKLSGSVLVSGGESLPYWWINQNSGRLQRNSSSQIHNQLWYYGEYKLPLGLLFFWDTEVSTSLAQDIRPSIIQSNIGFRSSFIELKAGLDEEFFGEYQHRLSLGNLINNTNARPIPKISIATNGWQPSPLFPRNIYYKAYLAHGWFEKDRVQSGAFLHHKSFHLQSRLAKNRLKLGVGLIHNAQWGGKNITTEYSQPTGFKNYTRIFFGRNGGKDALQTDKQNALGNHLGTYEINGSYQFKTFTLRNYWQFMWEDTSGLTPWNWRDGLVGIEVGFLNTPWLKHILLEIVRTNDQGAVKFDNDGNMFFEPDDFLNNGVYLSGWTYAGQVIGSPLFIRQQLSSGGYTGIFNMVNAWNFGVSGEIKKVEYHVKVTNFSNQGRRLELIDPPLKLWSVDIALLRKLNEKSELSVKINFQEGNIGGGKNLAVGLSYSYLLLH